MGDRSGVFTGDDPFDLIRDWMKAAEQTEPNDPNAMALATVDTQGLPDVRMVLLKEVEAAGLVFFTNYESRKGEQIEATGTAAMVLHWKSLRRQIRARGTVERLDDAASDAYYASRPLGSRIGAWASRQSQPLAAKSELVKAVAVAGARHGPRPKRPPFWGGYRIRPVEIEFWADGEFRLHDRFRWVRRNQDDGWAIIRLNP